MFNPRNGIIIPTDNHIFYREVAEATTNDRQPKPLCLLCSARSLRWALRMARNSENAHQCLACGMGGNPTESSWISVWKAKRTMGFLLFHIIYYNNYNHVYEWHYYHSWGAIHVLKMFFVFFCICLPDVQTWRAQDPSTDWIFWQPMIFPVNLGFRRYIVFALLSAGS